MKLLAFETATTAGAVALRSEGVTLGEVVTTTERLHTETLLPAALGLLKEADLDLSDLDAIVVDRGPGLFTGLRVGVATARSLASATGASLEAVTSLEVLARDPKADGAGRVLCALDAARGEVFVQIFKGGRSLLGPAVLRPEAVGPWCEAEGPLDLVLGGAMDRYGEVLGTLAADIASLSIPSPAVAAAIVEERGLRHEDPTLVVPLYLRDPDAVANFTVAPVGRGR
jgi:tRNA threonylcarbamoyladenosine biosynthesis protein TsaB